MKVLRRTAIVIACIASYAAVNYEINVNENLVPTRMSAVGDADVLQRQYERWKSALESSAAPLRYSLSLTPPQLHALSESSASGHVEFNFNTGAMSVSLSNVKNDAPLDIWATNGTRVFSKLTDPASLRHLGQIQIHNQTGRLATSLLPLMKEGFAIDQVLISQAGADPLQQPTLAGSLSLFQRLYAAEKSAVSTPSAKNSGLIAVANATIPTGFPLVFSDLVTQGEDLFFNGTFAGNGRSCGTCHPATNNFTIDANFIATLPADDPLFVAENIPALIFGNPANLDGAGKPRRLENPALMRAFGLIVENLDGMGDLENRFTMRSVPHNIGMTVSLTTPPNDLRPPDERTGWSGDGAPVGLVGGVATSGRLRDFIVGAIVQHYPKTMNRSFMGPSPDFRAPTVTEIDALEAFMLSLGRQTELQLVAGASGELVLKSAEAEVGKALFRDGVPGGTRTCQGCHGNAGANVVGGANPGNRNFNTGAELFLRNRINDPVFTVVGEPRPVDGGFGTNSSGTFTTTDPQPGFINENFGNGRFNTPSVVEAADSGPFFHNNVVTDIEESVRFYRSPEFVTANGGIIPFDDTQVVQVTKFLQVINAIDNVENLSQRSSDRALVALQAHPNPDDVIHRILQIAIADTQDAVDVLNQGGLHNSGGLPVNAVKQLERAIQRFQQAMNTSASDTARMNHVNNAKIHLSNSLTLMRF